MIIINVITLVSCTAVHIDNPRNRSKSKVGHKSLVPKIDWKTWLGTLPHFKNQKADMSLLFKETRPISMTSKYVIHVYLYFQTVGETMQTLHSTWLSSAHMGWTSSVSLLVRRLLWYNTGVCSSLCELELIETSVVQWGLCSWLLAKVLVRYIPSKQGTISEPVGTCHTDS